jgi:hypothetical protein
LDSHEKPNSLRELRIVSRSCSILRFDRKTVGQGILVVKTLPAKTLLGLLQMYEAAIADLGHLADPSVEALIGRLTIHRDEVAAALAVIDGTAS